MGLESIRRIERRETWAHLLEEPVLTAEQLKVAAEASEKNIIEYQRKIDSGEIPRAEIDPMLSPGQNILRVTEEAITKERKKLNATNPDKVLEEIKKMSPEGQDRAKSYTGR